MRYLQQAIKMIEEEQADLVLMDIVLQGEMDGIETAEVINSRFSTPVIYITAHDEDVIFERAKITEPLGYINKPFKQEELRKTIEIGLYKYRAEEDRKTLVTKLQSEKSKALGTVAAEISHEFINILTIIMLTAQLLESEFKDSSELKGSLATIIKACEDGTDIARKMQRIIKLSNEGSGCVLADIQQIMDQAIEFTEQR